jgi:hypothetical protein
MCERGSLSQNLHIFDGHDIVLRPGNGFDAWMNLVLSYHGSIMEIADGSTKLLVPGLLPRQQVALFIP